MVPLITSQETKSGLTVHAPLGLELFELDL